MSVEDPGRAADEARRAGGRIVVAPITLPGRGQIAILADPEGTPFGVIRTSEGDPDDYLAELNEVGVAGAVGAGRGTRRALLCATGRLRTSGPRPTVPVHSTSSWLPQDTAARRYARHSSPSCRQCGFLLLRVADAGATAALVRVRRSAGGRAARGPAGWARGHLHRPGRRPQRRARPAQGARNEPSPATKDAMCARRPAALAGGAALAGCAVDSVSYGVGVDDIYGPGWGSPGTATTRSGTGRPTSGCPWSGRRPSIALARSRCRRFRRGRWCRTVLVHNSDPCLPAPDATAHTATGAHADAARPGRVISICPSPSGRPV